MIDTTTTSTSTMFTGFVFLSGQFPRFTHNTRVKYPAIIRCKTRNGRCERDSSRFVGVTAQNHFSLLNKYKSEV